MKIVACVVGVVVGLGIAFGQTYRPQGAPVITRPSASWPIGNQPGLPPNPIIQAGDSGAFIVEFEDRLFTVSKYANDIPFVMIGGRTLSINGGMSAAP